MTIKAQCHFPLSKNKNGKSSVPEDETAYCQVNLVKYQNVDNFNNLVEDVLAAAMHSLRVTVSTTLKETSGELFLMTCHSISLLIHTGM